MLKKTRRLARPTAEIVWDDVAADGPAVVLVHGAGLDRSMYANQVEALAEVGVRVIALDLRGHGDSALAPATRFCAADALDDLVALVAASGAVRPVLVGHSLGGNLVQRLARDRPDLVSGIVVMDATWNVGPLSRIERAALRLAAPSLALVPARSLPGIMARASAATPDGIARAEAAFARMPKPRFLDVWRATVSLVEPDSAPPAAPARLALVRGELDRTGNIADAMPRWAASAGVAEHVVPGAGHVVTWDAPAAVSAILVETVRDWSAA